MAARLFQENKILKLAITCVSVLALTPSCSALQSRSEITAEEFRGTEPVRILSLGTCIRNEKDVNLQWLQTIEQKRIEFKNASGVNYITLSGSMIGMSNQWNTRPLTYVDILTGVLRNKGLQADQKIRLQFAYLDGELYIYWVAKLEAIKRHGLIQIMSNLTFSNYCDGEDFITTIQDSLDVIEDF